MAVAVAVQDLQATPRARWPPRAGDRALVSTIDTLGDTLLKTDFWNSAVAVAPATPRRERASQWATTPRATASRILSAALVGQEPSPSLADSLDARRETHHAFQVKRAQVLAQGRTSNLGQDTWAPSETLASKLEFEDKRYSNCSPKEFYLGERESNAEEAPRPPQGAGYSYPSYEGGRRPTLAERFGGSTPAGLAGGAGHLAAATSSGEVGPAAGTRQERIEALERGLLEHDEDRLRTIAAGTFPLLGPGGDPLLPVPPVEPHDTRLGLPHRLRVLSHNRASKQAMRNILLASEIMNREARDRPFADMDLVRHAAGREASPRAAPALRPVAPAAPSSSSGAHVGRPDGRPCRDFGELKMRETEALLQEAECLILEAPNEDRWSSLASQLCARAYEVDPPDVLRMVRVIGAAGARCGVKTRGRKELLRAADHLIQSLTARMQDATLDLIIEVLETMGDTGVGSQVYLDMIMALALACHHRDCQAVSAVVALRLATALGRLATSSLRLRPRGIGGPGASTNAKVMEVLQQRIYGGLNDCSEEDLARLDSYYIARLSGEAERHAIVSRMAELDIGFRERTKQYLPLMVRLQESLHRELPDCFRWSLSRGARNWLERLKLQGLKESAPWSLGDTDMFSSARAKLRTCRVDDEAH